MIVQQQREAKLGQVALLSPYQLVPQLPGHVGTLYRLRKEEQCFLTATFRSVGWCEEVFGAEGRKLWLRGAPPSCL